MFCGYFDTDHYFVITHNDPNKIFTQQFPILELHQKSLLDHPKSTVVLTEDHQLILTEDKSEIFRLNDNGSLSAEKTTQPPPRIRDAGYVIREDRLYMFGGIDHSSNSVVSDLYELDLQSVRWRKIDEHSSIIAGKKAEVDPLGDEEDIIFEEDEEDDSESEGEMDDEEGELFSAPKKSKSVLSFSRFGHIMSINSTKDVITVYGGRISHETDNENNENGIVDEIISINLRKNKWEMRKQKLPTPISHASSLTYDHKTCIFKTGMKNIWVRCQQVYYRVILSYQEPFCTQLLEKDIKIPESNEKNEDDNSMEKFAAKVNSQKEVKKKTKKKIEEEEEEVEGEEDDDDEKVKTNNTKQDESQSDEEMELLDDSPYKSYEYLRFLHFSPEDQVLMKNEYVDLIMDEETEFYLPNPCEETLQRTVFMLFTREILKSCPFFIRPDKQLNRGRAGHPSSTASAYPTAQPTKKRKGLFGRVSGWFSGSTSSSNSNNGHQHNKSNGAKLLSKLKKKKKDKKPVMNIGDSIMFLLPPILYKLRRSFKSELQGEFSNLIKAIYNFCVMTPVDSTLEELLLSDEFLDKENEEYLENVNIIKRLLAVDPPLIVYKQFLEKRTYDSLPTKYKLLFDQITDKLLRLFRFDNVKPSEVMKLKLIKQLLYVMKPFVSLGNPMGFMMKFMNTIAFSPLGKKLIIYTLDMSGTKKELKKVKQFFSDPKSVGGLADPSVSCYSKDQLSKLTEEEFEKRKKDLTIAYENMEELLKELNLEDCSKLMDLFVEDMVQEKKFSRENRVIHILDHTTVEYIEKLMKKYGITDLEDEHLEVRQQSKKKAGQNSDEDEKEEETDDDEDEGSDYAIQLLSKNPIIGTMTRKIQSVSKKLSDIDQQDRETEPRELRKLKLQNRLLRKKYTAVPISFVEYFLKTVMRGKREFGDFTLIQYHMFYKLFCLHTRLLEKRDFVVVLNDPQFFKMIKNLMKTTQPLVAGVYHNSDSNLVFKMFIGIINSLIEMLEQDQSLVQQIEKVSDPQKREKLEKKKEEILKNKFERIKKQFQDDLFFNLNRTLRRDAERDNLLVSGIGWINGLRGMLNNEYVRMAEIRYMFPEDAPGLKKNQLRMDEFRKQVRKIMVPKTKVVV